VADSNKKTSLTNIFPIVAAVVVSVVLVLYSAYVSQTGELPESFEQDFGGKVARTGAEFGSDAWRPMDQRALQGSEMDN
jgi:cell division protein FtsN